GEKADGYLGRKNVVPANSSSESSLALPLTVLSYSKSPGKLPEESLRLWSSYEDPWRHAIATQALAEYLAMGGQDSRAPVVLKQAVDIIVKAQCTDGL